MAYMAFISLGVKVDSMTPEMPALCWAGVSNIDTVPMPRSSWSANAWGSTDQ